MAASTVVDAGFLVALLSRRDSNHQWASSEASRHPPPWRTCEAALSEAFHLLGPRGTPALAELLRRGAVACAFQFGDETDNIIKLVLKYTNMPMSLADACLVRMTETAADPILLTTDTDFRVYRRHGRHTVPCVTPE